MLKQLSPTTIGILCVVGAGLCFSTTDMTIKFLSDGYPLHELVFARAAISLVVIMLVLMPLEGGFHNLKTKRLGMHILRGLCVFIANMAFFTGIATMPLAEATAIFFIAPLLITAMSVPFLGEKVGIKRWIAVVVGLVGVIVILRPGTEAFRFAALGPVIAATAYASMQIITRKIGTTERASTLAFFIQFTFLVLCSGIGLAVGDGRFSEGIDNPSLYFLLRAWTMPESSDFMLMLAIGTLSAFGAYLISMGYRTVEATTAAPFEYVVLPAAVFWSVTIFGEWPDVTATLGIFLIVGSGLYAFWRENIRGSVVAAKHPLPRNR
ncbi:MAG: DMT family transporter [Alphaproteobacteria bacterium]